MTDQDHRIPLPLAEPGVISGNPARWLHDGGIDNDDSEPCEKEPWSYEVDGREYEAWKVWHCPPPGPVGSGILYREIRTEDVLGPDNRWERHVYEIEVA